MPPIARQVLRSLPRSFELDDLIGAGNLGLLEAAARYCPEAHGGVPFEAYARAVIRGYILSSVRRREYVESTHPRLEGAPEPAAPDFIDVIDEQVLAGQIKKKMRSLPRRQASVLELHYSGEMRLSFIGCRFGIGKSRASRLHVDALRSLRACLTV